MDAPVDLELVASALGRLGLDAELVHEDLLALPEDASVAEEIAAMVMESEAGRLFDLRQPLDAAVVELVDAFRRAGVPCRLGTADGAPVVVVVQERRLRAHRLNLQPDLTLAGLVEAVVRVLPAGFTIRLCPRCVQAGAMPVVVLSAEELSPLQQALGAETLDRVLPPPPPVRVHAHVAAITPDALDIPDWTARFVAPPRERASVTTPTPRWEFLSSLDPRVAWDPDAERPPGDDFLALTQALCDAPLAACLEGGDDRAWADLLYRWALCSYVGARWDLLACRYNPGSSAQGVLGFGQLIWAYFIFEAMGAGTLARRVGELLEMPWVREQERSPLSLRQRAYYDLATFMRSGARGPQIGRVRELLELGDAGAWRDSELLDAALELHSEPRGDQFTHHRLYYAWPAPLYALARRAQVLAELPADNPFLAHPVSVEQVDMDAEVVGLLQSLLTRLDEVERGPVPRLLEPLPVIVDVLVTRLEDGIAYGTTQVSEGVGEHNVRAACSDEDMAVGEVWSLHVDQTARATATATHSDGTRVRYRIAVPGGEWLARIS